MPQDALTDVNRFDPVPDPRPIDEPWPELKWPVPADAELVGDTVRLNPLDLAADAAELFAALDHDVVWAHLPMRLREQQHMRRADGTIRDSVLFSITAEDWPSVREGLVTRLRGCAE
ncbi:hypothetical protein [Nocardia sp. NPDC058705]|uniref:hypothetical protein n=1 Tax=Nocardia sp. NPDC058705 TaxID=3346609 RepID=UPI0036C441A8